MDDPGLDLRKRHRRKVFSADGKYQKSEKRLAKRQVQNVLRASTMYIRFRGLGRRDWGKVSRWGKILPRCPQSLQ